MFVDAIGYGDFRAQRIGTVTNRVILYYIKGNLYHANRPLFFHEFPPHLQQMKGEDYNSLLILIDLAQRFFSNDRMVYRF